MRAIAVSAALFAFVGADSAVGTDAAPEAFVGTFSGGGQISFELGGAGEKAVKKISIQGIAADCRRGSATLNFEISGGTPVLDDRTFAVRSKDRKARALVKGRFDRDFESVKGVARVHGKIFEGKPRCDSGRQKFKAS